jgi:hypothetical protein
MGIRKADGSIMTNPPMDTRIQSDDQIFAIAEDDDKIDLSNLSRIPLEDSLILKNGKHPSPSQSADSSSAGTAPAPPSSASWITTSPKAPS